MLLVLLMMPDAKSSEVAKWTSEEKTQAMQQVCRMATQWLVVPCLITWLLHAALYVSLLLQCCCGCFNCCCTLHSTAAVSSDALLSSKPQV